MAGWGILGNNAIDTVLLGFNELSNMEHGMVSSAPTLELIGNHEHDWDVWDGPCSPASAIVLMNLNAGGSLYAVGDTGTINGGGTLATYTVTSIGAGGAVTGFSFTVGAGYNTGTNVATTTGGSQPGSGTGLTFNITQTAVCAYHHDGLHCFAGTAGQTTLLIAVNNQYDGKTASGATLNGGQITTGQFNQAISKATPHQLDAWLLVGKSSLAIMYF
jgi:hypothetical protein